MGNRQKIGFSRLFSQYLFRTLEKYRVTIEGLKCEKFISAVVNSGIHIEDMQIIDETTVSFVCGRIDYKDIKSLADKHYVLTLVDRTGMIPDIRNLITGRGLVAGIVLVIGLFTLQQLYITEIEIKGNYGISEAEIRNVISEIGMREFSRKTDYSKDKVKKAIFNEFPEVTWINIVEKGNYVLIELVEGIKVETERKIGLHDIVASKSGYIEEIMVKNGYKCVKEGDYVEKGQVLISSQVPINNTTYDESRTGTFRFVDADGIVKAKVIYKFSFSCPEKEYSEDKLRNAVDKEIRKYIRENVPDYIEIYNKELSFDVEKNIINGVVTLEVIETIGIQKENEIAE